ncbi:hypothetical protein GLOIN_2v1693718 [Rhizophagus irregularis DAOM 181602=DAOM 197198]|uniref:Uncharacterized protein n=1 Tax=Rhizophagus irregularis (strain DAOM 181602 / DAOM 197198 / MUCL 43194) TaxID=747089 RepID=A0A2P4PBJ7_RHIID|nr:hypothetical protein GLOIN_2v1693718 [Rhizophagus irregularis DAOM 181602=DAOM 197198]POG62751.1 hypothetical protein GLOIN_2v1693718 [Rhizophagus irregularis DAOM 181602=DAOM 197198]|eukprot:XP_025169617.1 hypothetical protein GLOIN_2v1693718 [Rhizophagus irregularis DAOM 181602=DAOM 197198]
MSLIHQVLCINKMLLFQFVPLLLFLRILLQPNLLQILYQKYNIILHFLVLLFPCLNSYLY